MGRPAGRRQPVPGRPADRPGPDPAGHRRAAELAAPRAVRWGAGFTIGGAPPEMAAGAIQRFKTGWKEAGGNGQPRIVALSYFSLGEEHSEESLHNLRTYYGFLGDWAERVATEVPRTPEAIRTQAAAFQELGVDELIFDPTVAHLDQVDRLADTVHRERRG